MANIITRILINNKLSLYMKKNLFILCLIAALVLPVNAVAQHHHHHYPGPSRRELPPCATAEQMQAVMQTLKGQSFDDKKLEIAQLCVVIGLFCTDDLAVMAKTFSFEDNRLAFLKFAYPYCTDPERYPTLRDSFSFSSNYDALMDYIYPDMRR